MYFVDIEMCYLFLSIMQHNILSVAATHRLGNAMYRDKIFEVRY